MRKPPIYPRKTPQQSRSRVTVEAILEAAAHILTREGYQSFTTNLVAERAGVSIGSLYQYYPNKQSLLAALHARHLDEIKARGFAVIDEVSGDSFAEALSRLIRTFVASHLETDDLHRIIAEETPMSLAKISTQELLKCLLEAYRPLLKVDDLELAAYIASVTIKAVVHNALQDRLDDLREGRVEKNLFRLLLSYLVCDGPEYSGAVP